MKLIRILGAVVALSAAGSATAAVVQKDAEGGVVTISGGMVMKEFQTGERAVYDAKLGLVTAIFPARRVYTTFTREQFCTAVGEQQVGPQVWEARPWSVLNVVPNGYQVRVTEGYTVEEVGDSRRVVEVLLPRQKPAPGGPPRVKVTEAGSGGAIAGFSTTRYHVYVNGELEEEIWMAKDRRLLAELDDLDMAAVLGFFQCDEETTGGEETVADNRAYLQLFEKGWPLRVKSGGDNAYYRVLALDIRDVPRNTFGVPKRYTAIPFDRRMLGIDDAEE